MADRFFAGEFNGSYHRAAKEPECVALGILHQNIQYHMDRKRPFMAADRAADRARVAAEAVAEATAASSAHGTNPVFVCVERGGSASAATAVSGIVGKLECASAELEAAEAKTAVMKKRLQELSAAQLEREAAARRFSNETDREIAHLQGLLAGEQKRVEASGRQVRTKYFVFHVTNFELFSSQVCEEWCTRVLRLGARALPQGGSDAFCAYRCGAPPRGLDGHSV